jgi:hypothetical protein
MSGHASRRCLGCTSARLLVSDEHIKLQRTVPAIDHQFPAHARGHVIVAQLAPPWLSSQCSMTFVPSLSTGSLMYGIGGHCFSIIVSHCNSRDRLSLSADPMPVVIVQTEQNISLVQPPL